MSHNVTVRTQVRDPAALAAACQRLNLEPPDRGVAQLFAGQAEGLIVRLPQWRYPVVFDITTGEAHYDNFAGRWGEQKLFNQLLQAYAVEKAKIDARRRGQVVSEQLLLDGSIKLQIRRSAASGGGGAV